MEPFYESIDEYKRQMEKGLVPKAYRGIMEYMLDLRNYFSKNYPDDFVSGSIYHGYMDMSYFSFTPKSFAQKKLKIAIVFIHATCRFEAWLAGNNKHVQSTYWKLFNKADWKEYPLVPKPNEVDAIIEHVLDGNPDFQDLDGLTKHIESATLAFIKNIDRFLITH